MVKHAKFALNKGSVDFEGGSIVSAKIWVSKQLIIGMGPVVVCGLSFELSDGRSYHYGDKRGTVHLFITPEKKKVVGFYGRIGGRLDGIGFLLAPL